jgi:heterodisulfide reductase subunit B2
MKVTFYPGCSLEGTANDYAGSIHGVCQAMRLDLQEIDDWNCCGATAAHNSNHLASLQLAGRNLVLSSSVNNRDMLVPCPLCFNRLKTAAHEMQGEHRSRYEVKLDNALPRIWDLANFFGTDELINKIVAAVVKPLEGLKVVCY